MFPKSTLYIYVHNSTNYIDTYKLRLSANRIYIYIRNHSVRTPPSINGFGFSLYIYIIYMCIHTYIYIIFQIPKTHNDN